MNRVLHEIGTNVTHYMGVGYQYFYSIDRERGNTAKLQVSRNLLAEFESRKGRINTTGMPHLEVLDQGNGWLLLTSDKPENDGVVMAFLRRLNKWVLTKDLPKEPAPTPAFYKIETKAIPHKGLRPIMTAKPAPKPKVSRADLVKLQQAINEKYGH